MKTLTERCEIELQSLALGKVQFRDSGLTEGVWLIMDVTEATVFYWVGNDYRIKPEPREFYAPISHLAKTEKEAETLARMNHLVGKIIKIKEIL